MREKNYILRGSICYSTKPEQLQTIEQGYLVCVDGKSCGVYKTLEALPENYQMLPIKDYGDKLIIPGLVDLHLHASQYAFRGLGMDMELIEWLNVNTFPEEAKYADTSYAMRAYSQFVKNLQQGATTRACIFATIHTDATELLMDLLEKSGLYTMVGKVNMDRNAPENLCEENAETSAADTIKWIEECQEKYQNTKPIITPRFIPSCTDELMIKLSQIRRDYKLPVQSHLSENPREIQWVQELCPQTSGYADAYDQAGILGGPGHEIMAHCVYLTEEEEKLLLERGVYIAHCPDSNTNLASGAAPIRRYLEHGLHVGLGTDIAGGYSDSIFSQMAEAIRVSKLRWRLFDDTLRPLTLAEAFYMGTMGGGAFFGKVGSFIKGYEFDAVVLDDSKLKAPYSMTALQRLERAVYLPEKCEVTAKYVAGNKVI
ncbi:MAG: amidohydrolase family protein [bacterium]|nr:amidohydrolase family protein [bacterium]